MSSAASNTSKHSGSDIDNQDLLSSTKAENLEQLPSEPTKQHLQNKNQVQVLGEMFENLSSSFRGMNSRQLPAWDVNSKHHTIKSHIKLAESMAKRYGWTDTELASELFLSLRGNARSIAETFSNKTQMNIKSLKEELLRHFHIAKPQSQILLEFNSFEWKPNKLTIPQMGAILRNKIIKMNSNEKSEYEWNSNNEVWLRSRIIEAIKQARPEFGNALELMDIDSKSSIDLANFAQNKYEIYKQNQEVNDEHVAALIATEPSVQSEETNPQDNDRWPINGERNFRHRSEFEEFWQPDQPESGQFISSEQEFDRNGYHDYGDEDFHRGRYENHSTDRKYRRRRKQDLRFNNRTLPYNHSSMPFSPSFCPPNDEPRRNWYKNDNFYGDNVTNRQPHE